MENIMILIGYSIIGALEKFPYIVIPLVIGIVFLCNWGATKLELTGGGKIFFTAICSIILTALIVVPSWLAYKNWEREQSVKENEIFRAQFPISEEKAIEIVTQLPEVKEKLEQAQSLEYPKRTDLFLGWSTLPNYIPATEDGAPWLSVQESGGAAYGKLAYRISFFEGEAYFVYTVDAKTGEISTD